MRGRRREKVRGGGKRTRGKVRGEGRGQGEERGERRGQGVK